MNKGLRADWFAMASLWLIVPLAYLFQGQDANWDLQNYHLYNTISLIEGSFLADTAPAGIQSYFNPLVSLPAYWIHRLASSPAQSFWAGLGLAGFQGLCGPLLYCISRSLLPFPRSMAALASGFGLSSPILLSEAGTSFADLTLCVLQLGAIFVCSRSICAESPRKLRLLAIGWGVIGAACGIKFSCIFVFPVLIFLSMASLFPRAGATSALKLLSQAARVILLPALIGFGLFGWLWLSRSWADNGNPFFPLFSALFGDSRLFWHDNHIDTRFIPDGLNNLLLAAFQEFQPRPGLRAELAYRDLRPLLWVYGGILSLAALAIVHFTARRVDSLSRLPLLPQGWVPLQIGLLSSYGIWLKAAGIARYGLPIQAMSGISLWISLSILVDVLYRRPLPRASSLRGAHPLRSHGLPLLFTALTFICISTQMVPSWGRTNFGTAWNSLRPLDSGGQPVAGAPFIVQGELFPADRPVVLLSKPLGWLKQYAPNGSSFHLVNSEMRPLAIERIITLIRRRGDGFTTVDFVDHNHKLLGSDRPVNLLEGGFRFRTTDCTDYGTPTGLRIRICSTQLAS